MDQDSAAEIEGPDVKDETEVPPSVVCLFPQLSFFIFYLMLRRGGPQAQSAYMLQEVFQGHLSLDLSFYKTSITFSGGVLYLVTIPLWPHTPLFARQSVA